MLEAAVNQRNGLTFIIVIIDPEWEEHLGLP